MFAARSVDVCIATFKRPASLAQLLQSLIALERRELVRRVIVVDNDRDGTARSTVEDFSGRAPFELVYDIEPRQNISCARNRALLKVEAPYLAFVDDDETVSPGWLVSMRRCLAVHRADAVLGPVVKVLPPGAPAWAASHPVFSTPSLRTGANVSSGATNNVLIRTAALGQPRQLFDDAYGLTGGEDADFFERMKRGGLRLVWCDDAPVFEAVPPCRVTDQWVRRRSYRSGQTFYRVFVRPLPPHRKAAWLAQKSLHAMAATLWAAATRAVRHRRHAEASAAMFRCAGQLSGLIRGHLIEEYDARKGR